MRVHWSVEGSTQHTDIPDDKLSECKTNDERQDLITESIQNDFDQKITWTINQISNEDAL